MASYNNAAYDLSVFQRQNQLEEKNVINVASNQSAVASRKFAIKRGFGKKKTAQYTLTGELVKVWESTAEIQREFGWSDSSIQSACRGEQRTSHGYVWRYL